MLDLRSVRTDPDRVKAALARRGTSWDASIDVLLSADEQRRAAVTESDGLKGLRNEVSREIGERKKRGEDASASVARMREVGARIAELDGIVAATDERIRDLLLGIPNVPLDEVPHGGEDANRVVGSWGEPPVFAFAPRPHWEIGETLGILDMPRGARVSGSGFPVLRGMGARLQRALIDFFLDVHTREHGYEELRIPYLVTSETMTGTGQLPKFADEAYHVEKYDLWLIPTAEVPITNLHRDELLAPDRLPIRYTAYSPCFRSEAGAAGKDTRGLLRVHQFDKVELVRYERPEHSREALDELTRHAETLLERLELPYRRVLLSTGDMGFGSAMTYDLEAWAPGVEKWLEVSSCSTFTDYQARRANLRFRPAAVEKPEHVHTLNGSALALPRVVAALLETHQQEDGSVRMPPALHPYLGFERIAAPPA
ncbi:MAG: serine--tRNA ligase [Gemmatimonadetes bacterium]|nr:serine--tRNA ligase [Gemmatimonadota bacterium]